MKHRNHFILTTAGAVACLTGGLLAQTAQAESADNGFGKSRFGRGMAAPQGDRRAKRPPRHAGGRFWGEGVTMVGIDDDEDDFIWGLDVRGNEIFVAGERGPVVGGDRMMFVAKYTTNGEDSLQLDPSFGTGGIASFDFSSYQGVDGAPAIEGARGLRLQADGRIVILGRAKDPSVAAPDASTPTMLVAARINTDGSLDSSFGIDGITAVHVGGAGLSGGEQGPQDEAPWGLEMDEFDRALVSLGATAEDDTGRSDRDRFALRLTVDGQVDTSYGSDGTGIVDFDVFEGNNDNQRNGLALEGGGLLSVGYTRLAGRNQVFLAKLTPEGEFDPSFSGDGRLRFTPFATGFAEAYGAVQLRDGSFVTTGYGNLFTGGETPPEGVPLPGTDAVQFRIRADGSFDTEFGTHGGLAYNVNNSNERGRTITGLKDDTLIIGGTAIPAGPPAQGEPNNPEDAMLFAMTPDGKVRDDFEPEGHRLYDFGGADEEFFNTRTAPSGRFVVAAGYSRLGEQPNAQGILVVIPVPRRHWR